MQRTLSSRHEPLLDCTTHHLSSKSQLCLCLFPTYQINVARATCEYLHSLTTARFSIVLSGLVHFKLPSSSLGPSKSEAWIEGGRYGLVIAADISSQSRLGHFAEFPGDAATVLVQVPTANGEVPEHDILYAGPCGWEEMINL